MGRQQKLVQAGYISVARQGDVTVHLDRQRYDGVAKDVNLALAEPRAAPQMRQLTQRQVRIVRGGSSSVVRPPSSESLGLLIGRPGGCSLAFPQQSR